MGVFSAYSNELTRCAFCHDQCMSATAELVATGDQSLVISRIATLLRLVEAGRLEWSQGLADRLYYALNDGRQRCYCIFAKEGQEIHPFLRAARAEAVRRGLAPAPAAAVAEHVRQTGNIFGVAEDLPAPFAADPGAPILLHDAAARILTPAAVSAARALLEEVGPAPAEVAVPSAGYVEYDLGFVDLAKAALVSTTALLSELPPGPVVTTDPVVALALKELCPLFGIPFDRPVYHLSQYLASRFSGRLPSARREVTVVFHDAGALARGLGVVEAPRTLLRQVPGVQLVEPVTTGPKAASDGPLAGYPSEAVAAAIAAARMQELKATGAALVVTASPYSLRSLSQVPDGLPVVDLAQFLHA